MTSSNAEAMLNKRCHRSSSSNSPHKLGKVGPKHMRTVVTRDLTKITPEAALTTSQNLVSEVTLTLEHFLVNTDETREQSTLKSNMLMYTFQKYLLHQQHDDTTNKHILRNMQYFCNEITPEHAQPSHIHYMELVNENPDSDETMSLVAENILDKFGNKVQDG